MRRVRLKRLRDHAGLGCLDLPRLGSRVGPNRGVVFFSSGRGRKNLFFNCTMMHYGRRSIVANRTLVPADEGSQVTDHKDAVSRWEQLQEQVPHMPSRLQTRALL